MTEQGEQKIIQQSDARLIAIERRISQLGEQQGRYKKSQAEWWSLEPWKLEYEIQSRQLAMEFQYSRQVTRVLD
jgi:hypothetical protein